MLDRYAVLFMVGHGGKGKEAETIVECRMG
jgi:hypothetical protein